MANDRERGHGVYRGGVLRCGAHVVRWQRARTQPARIGKERRGMPQQPTPQHAAIHEVRERYARGDLSFETFKRGLDALVLAHDADECRAILEALPSLPHAAP